jgi:hypothetical protein
MNRIEHDAPGANDNQPTSEPASLLHAWVLALFVFIIVAMAVTLGSTVDMGDTHTPPLSAKAKRIDKNVDTRMETDVETPARDAMQPGGNDTNGGQPSATVVRSHATRFDS